VLERGLNARVGKGFTMTQRLVVKAHAKLFPHANAERLELCKVGTFQLVVQKGLYADGDVIIVAPDKALLPPALASRYVNSDTGVSYLHGEAKNRVGVIRLRGELSQGVIIPNAGYEHLPFDEDISGALGITFYEPPIPMHLAGEVEAFAAKTTAHFTEHDVEQFGIYQNEFVPGEDVIVTEKLHGSQGVYYRNASLEWVVTSKGLSQKGLGLLENAGNTYWRAARGSGLLEAVNAVFPDGEVQVFAEVLPVQKGFNYGFDAPGLKVFKVVRDGVVLPYDALPEWFKANFVPVLYRGAYTPERILPLKEGLETVSGKGLHIREGVVLAPVQPRRNADGHDLLVKLISDKYAKKETGEEIS
jgi:RNA ligase (TIGR02306 family)